VDTLHHFPQFRNIKREQPAKKLHPKKAPADAVFSCQSLCPAADSAVSSKDVGNNPWMDVTSNGGSVMRGGLIKIERPTRKTPIVTLVGL
jgi:hypothetical protein